MYLHTVDSGLQLTQPAQHVSTVDSADVKSFCAAPGTSTTQAWKRFQQMPRSGTTEACWCMSARSDCCQMYLTTRLHSLACAQYGNQS